jgi:hypothetical protein
VGEIWVDLGDLWIEWAGGRIQYPESSIQHLRDLQFSASAIPGRAAGHGSEVDWKTR